MFVDPLHESKTLTGITQLKTTSDTKLSRFLKVFRWYFYGFSQRYIKLQWVKGIVKWEENHLFSRKKGKKPLSKMFYSISKRNLFPIDDMYFCKNENFDIGDWEDIMWSFPNSDNLVIVPLLASGDRQKKFCVYIWLME